MTILIAPDSFKHALSAAEVSEALARGLNREAEAAGVQFSIQGFPMADGGEGTSGILARGMNARAVEVQVLDPLERPILASYYVSPDNRTAIMEMAASSGIELLSPGEYNPMKATTFGTGQMILHALERGVQRIIIGIGGSATVDGGIGMAAALGYRFLDARGTPLQPYAANLSRIARIEEPGNASALRGLRVDIASDVQSPLLGPRGAAPVFGPQKGADPEMVERLEEGLGTLFQVWKNQGMVASELPGDGAAGGLGAGLRAFVGARSSSGAELVGGLSGFERALAGAQAVITGEGRTDAQTASGKVCAYVARQARSRGIPVFLVSGSIEGSQDSLLEEFDLAMSISPGAVSLDQALAETGRNLEYYGRLLGRIILGLPHYRGGES
ncbi:glycerate kinase [Spirochaeta lutea]|uniref:Glycerate kinase n=1 Tax=Spirochaeta lutea TaxID=1480694 RepID=A0A098QWE4_9SPIO|nr:glycerate kinase [Spirochaeta lutea]KGE72039.1 hypothetical protein DC28_07980 [Spirochaeta lutea]